MRATSSATSHMRLMSVRKNGTTTSLFSILKSSFSSSFCCSSAGSSRPSRAFILSGSNGRRLWFGSELSTSIMPSMTSPAPSCSTSSHARLTASRVMRGSRPFSKRPEASVRMPSAFAVIRTVAPWKFADSKTTVLVSSIISEFAPPITPATATGLSLSQMASILSLRS